MKYRDLAHGDFFRFVKDEDTEGDKPNVKGIGSFLSRGCDVVELGKLPPIVIDAIQDSEVVKVGAPGLFDG